MSELKEGTKYDQDKPRYDLIPMLALEDLATLYKEGAKKYDDRNWEKGINFTRICRAIMSHLVQIFKGEYIDPETGCYHSTAIAWNGLALTHFFKYRNKYKEFNDLPL